MSNYALHYWPIPFRGQLIRWVMTYAGAQWDEVPFDQVAGILSTPPGDLPGPFMAPPALHDRGAGLWLAQMPAILTYLGDVHGLMPDSAAARARVIKVICDANDVLDTVTRGGGAQLWTGQSWAETGLPRLMRWLEIFERQTDTQAQPDLGHVVTAALWHTMGDRLPPLAEVIATHAPAVAGMSRDIAAHPTLAAFDAAEKARLGDVYCGGQIETSLRAVLNMQERVSNGPI